jgi:murein DD-endopeptidase MepM/ murein hydrolase activator NlpD
MSNKQNRFDLLIIPSDTSRVKRFSVSRRAVYGGSMCLAILVVFVLFSTYHLSRYEALNLSFTMTKADNERLRSENDVYHNSLEKLKGQVSYIQDRSKEMARQAKMEPQADIDSQVGVGGPETVDRLAKVADQLEHQVMVIGDRLRAEQLRLATIPSGLPVLGYQTAGFGIRRNPFGEGGSEFHEGMDIAVEFGTPVSATADGVVFVAGPNSGYGNLVAIYHTNGITSRYGHLSRVAVQQGQRVKRGDLIGYAGSTGRSTGPHVHYELRLNDQPVNPIGYMGKDSSD